MTQNFQVQIERSGIQHKKFLKNENENFPNKIFRIMQGKKFRSLKIYAHKWKEL